MKHTYNLGTVLKVMQPQAQGDADQGWWWSYAAGNPLGGFRVPPGVTAAPHDRLVQGWPQGAMPGCPQ